MKKSILVCSMAVLTLAGSASARAGTTVKSTPDETFETAFCASNPKLQAEKSQELQAIVNADQEDREDFQHLTQAKAEEVALRDMDRRKRVAEIFAEGCFKTAADYAAAALVFQHGTVPDHFFQAFLWAKRAVDLGDVKQKLLMADAIDRYLVNTGHKQLFGTQAQEPKWGECWCLQPVEKSFPADERLQYTGKSVTDALKWVDSLNAGKSCPAAQECDQRLSPSPAGTIPGFW